MMIKYAVIVAGGTGTRMGYGIPKQFIMLRQKPVLFYTIQAFVTAFPDIQVILVAPADHINESKNLIDTHFKDKKILITTGGATRFHSVKNGLGLVDKDSIVFVHDGVRCLVSPELIHRCYAKAKETGSAIPAIPSKDSVRLRAGDQSDPIDRNNVMLVQTPQTFQSKILLPAFNVDFSEKFTDEATVVEASGTPVTLVEGEESNIKITRPVDLLIAEQWLGDNTPG